MCNLIFIVGCPSWHKKTISTIIDLETILDNQKMSEQLWLHDITFLGLFSQVWLGVKWPMYRKDFLGGKIHKRPGY